VADDKELWFDFGAGAWGELSCHSKYVRFADLCRLVGADDEWQIRRVRQDERPERERSPSQHDPDYNPSNQPEDDSDCEGNTNLQVSSSPLLLLFTLAAFQEGCFALGALEHGRRGFSVGYPAEPCAAVAFFGLVGRRPARRTIGRAPTLQTGTAGSPLALSWFEGSWNGNERSLGFGLALRATIFPARGAR
jgi:hypothetical protein